MEIQQAPFYADYIRQLGWVVEHIGHSYIYIKQFPLIGGLMKIQRCAALPEPQKLIPLIRKYKIARLAMEPDRTVSSSQLQSWTHTMKSHVHISSDFFLHTKTIRVDISQESSDIFKQFSEAKRRGVRRARKHGISAAISNDIDTLLRIKNQSAGFLGWITTHGQSTLWREAFPKHADILIARTSTGKPVAGVLLLYHQKQAYYWIAGSIHDGKKLFAPTLLVWEALLHAKKRGKKVFDFLGIWDDRLPDKNRQWIGFTKFKEGFGGEAIYYPFYKP